MARKRKINPKIWRKVRKKALGRDRYKCRWCGKRSKGNHVHHIKKKSKYPSLMYSLSNLVTLCKRCHKKTYGKEGKYVNSFGGGKKSYPSTPKRPKRKKTKRVERRRGPVKFKVKKYKKKTYKVKVKRPKRRRR
jgi:hypothetical protein